MLFTSGKKVAIPKVVGDNIEFYYIDDIKGTIPGIWRNTGAEQSKFGYAEF